jgi:hypothetical protein
MSSLQFAFVATTVGLVAPALMTPLDWDRYYLLPVFYSTIFISIGVAFLIRKAIHFVQTKFTFAN